MKLFILKMVSQIILDIKNKNTSKLFDKKFSITKNINNNEKCEIFVSFNLK